MIIPFGALPTTEAIRGPIIVGSGPVGMSLARAFALRGMPSCILEAGETAPTRVSAEDLATEDTSAPLHGSVDGRTRQIGGGVNLWGGQLAFPHIKEAGPTGDAPAGWPIALTEITSRGLSATSLLGQQFELDTALGPHFEAAKAQLVTAGLELITTAWLRYPKLPKWVWVDLEASTHITLVHGAFVAAIEVDESGTTIGVRIRAGDGTERRLLGAPVILACGTIETVRLLLQPVRSARAPWADLDWLGRGFNEHLDGAVATVTARNKRLLLDVFDPAVLAGIRYSCKTFLQVSPDTPDGRRPLSAVGMLTLPGNIRNSIAELRMLLGGLTPRATSRELTQLAHALAAASRETLPLAWRFLRHKRIATMLRGASTLRVSVEQPVRRESRITLSELCDSRGVQRARVNWIKGQAEGQVFLAKAKRMKAWAEGCGAASVDIDPLLLQDPAAFAAAADDGLHHAGGARMAASSNDGVVDKNLAVFNTSNLYCCGAVTFPRLGFANPTLTAVALADRLADHLANRAR